MKTYLISGHGEVRSRTRKFTLGKDQYVVFAQSCGLPAIKKTIGTLWPIRIRTVMNKSNRTQMLLRSSKRLLNYIRSGNRTKTHLKNPIILTPGSDVVDMIIDFRDPSNRIAEQMGVYNVQEKPIVYSYRHPKTKKIINKVMNRRGYMFGRGKTYMLSRIIGSRPGVYYVHACRTRPGFNEISNVNINRMLRGEKPSVRLTRSEKNVNRYERRITSLFAAKSRI